MGDFVLFWHKGLGFCPRGVLYQRGFVQRGFVLGGFVLEGFCPTPDYAGLLSPVRQNF